MKKLTIAKDWWTAPAKKHQAPSLNPMDLITDEVCRLEDIPELITAHEAAAKLKKHPKTIQNMFCDGRIGSIKIGGSRYTTIGFLTKYMQDEIRKNG